MYRSLVDAVEVDGYHRERKDYYTVKSVREKIWTGLPRHISDPLPPRHLMSYHSAIILRRWHRKGDMKILGQSRLAILWQLVKILANLSWMTLQESRYQSAERNLPAFACDGRLRWYLAWISPSTNINCHPSPFHLLTFRLRSTRWRLASQATQNRESARVLRLMDAVLDPFLSILQFHNFVQWHVPLLCAFFKGRIVNNPKTQKRLGERLSTKFTCRRASPYY